MPFTIHREPEKDKVITMGQADQPVADYYPPGATEPIVRPAHIPAPEPTPEVKEELNAEVDKEVADDKKTASKAMPKKK